MAKKKKQKPKQFIGRREQVDFPELEISELTAKIDTGAYTSTLHCNNIHIKEEGEKKFLCFHVLDPTHPSFSEREYCFSEFRKKKIKNSFGDWEERYLIKTKIQIAGRIIKSIISLTDRGTMRYPVLIGRRLLKNKFIVDVSLLNVGASLTKNTMSKFIKSGNVTVLVADMDRAVKFYTETLGLKLKSRYASFWAEVEAPGITIALHPTSERTKGSGNLSIGFSVDDIKQVTDELGKKGITFNMHDDKQILLAFFNDPDGTQLYFGQQKTKW